MEEQSMEAPAAVDTVPTKIDLGAGKSVTLTRDGTDMKVCTPKTCLIVPVPTANEFLAWVEFFEALKEETKKEAPANG